MQQRFFISLLVCALVTFMTLTPAFAEVDGDVIERVQQLAAQGADSYSAGRYERALQYFEDAYELYPVADLLFNIGRCYEQLGEWDDAIHHFEEYVRAPGTDDEVRDQTMDRIHSLREFKAAEEMGANDAGDVASTARRSARTIATMEVEEPSRFAGLASMSAGAGFLLGGLMFGMMASSNAGRIDDTSLNYDERLSAQSSARTQGIVADVFLVSGVATAALGTYLLFFSDRSGSAHAAGSHRISPWIGPNGAGLGVTLDY